MSDLNKRAASTPRIRASRKRKASSQVKEKVTVICAFCGGTGKDPFGIMSPLATCQVCGGQGHHTLRLPIAPCVFCRGTGVHPGLRMTCTSCDGVGMVEIPEDAVTCPCCAGTGRAADYLWPGSALSCTGCGGKGVVSARLPKSDRLRKSKLRGGEEKSGRE